MNCPGETLSELLEEYATMASGSALVEEQAERRDSREAEANGEDSQKKRNSSVTRIRVPSIRVKAPDRRTPYMIIRGRLGKLGEKVVVLGEGQTWPYTDPPITIRYETDSESDLMEIVQSGKSQKQRKKGGGYTYSELILDTDSKDEVGSELPRTRKSNSFHEKGDRSSTEGPELPDLYDHNQEYVGTFRTAYHYKEPVNRFTGEMDPNSEVAICKEKATVCSRAHEKDLEIDASHGFRVSLDAKIRFHVPTQESTESAEDLDLDLLEITGDEWKELFKEEGRRTGTASADERNLDLPVPGSGFESGETGNLVINLLSLDPRSKLCKLRETFHEHRRFFTAVEEVDPVRSDGGGTETRKHRSRNDLRAFSYIQKHVMPKKEDKNGIGIIGEIPGTEVGDHFFYRLELLLTGIHRPPQAGIDFIDSKKSKYRDANGLPLTVAISIVSSRGGKYLNKYEGDTLIYTGQGDGTGDQKLARGNLALKNTCDLGLCVRVILRAEVAKGEPPSSISFEGCPSLCSPSGLLYIYDGLYNVECYYEDVGPRGSKVWKFRLVRRSGQKKIPETFQRLF